MTNWWEADKKLGGKSWAKAHAARKNPKVTSHKKNSGCPLTVVTFFALIAGGTIQARMVLDLFI